MTFIVISAVLYAILRTHWIARQVFAGKERRRIANASWLAAVILIAAVIVIGGRI